jgi:hypothetical protein
LQWFALVGASLATVILLGAVGVPLTRVIGLRGFWAVAAAPAFAVTIIGGSAVIAPLLGIGWSVLPVVIVTVLIGVVLWLFRRLTRRYEPVMLVRRFDAWLFAGVLTAVVLLTARVLTIIGDPSNISQTFDNIFHLNGVRFVLETENASSLSLGRMTNPGGDLGFYPAAWHGLVSLIVQLSGVSIPVAVNAVTLMVSAVMWPLGIILLTRTFFGRSPSLSITAGALAASIPVFPILLMDYGVLYPYQLAVALLPVALAATARALGLVGARVAPGRGWWAIAVAGCLPGLALAHPGGFLGWLAFTAPMVVAFAVLHWRRAPRAAIRWAISGAFLAYLAVGAVLVRLLRPPAEARGWPTRMSILEAVGQVLTISAWYLVPSVLAAIAVFAGVIWAIITRSVPSLIALGMYAIAATLFVIVGSLPFPQLRDAFTGGWYNNLPRLAALLPIAMVPLGAYGVACTWTRLTAHRAIRNRTVRWPRGIRAVVAGVIAVIGVMGLQSDGVSPMPTAQRWASGAFVLGPQSALLSSDEAAILERLDHHVPDGVAVAGSPWTGASLAFAYANRPVLMPHTLMEITDDLDLINGGLADTDPGSAVCDAVEEMGVGFVLDFSGREVHAGEHVYPGLEDLATSDAVRLVDQQGDARLYEIVACEM